MYVLCFSKTFYLRFQHRNKINSQSNVTHSRAILNLDRRQKSVSTIKIYPPKRIFTFMDTTFPEEGKQISKQAVKLKEKPNFRNQTETNEGKTLFFHPPSRNRTNIAGRNALNDTYSSYPIFLFQARDRLINCFILFLILIFRTRSENSPPNIASAWLIKQHKNFFFFASLWDVNVIYYILFSYQTFSQHSGFDGYLWWWRRDVKGWKSVKVFYQSCSSLVELSLSRGHVVLLLNVEYMKTFLACLFTGFLKRKEKPEKLCLWTVERDENWRKKRWDFSLKIRNRGKRKLKLYQFFKLSSVFLNFFKFLKISKYF